MVAESFILGPARKHGLQEYFDIMAGLCDVDSLTSQAIDSL